MDKKAFAGAFAGGAFVGLMLLSACEVRREVAAIVLDLNGTALISNFGVARALPLPPNSRWQTGQKIHTETNASADILLLPGALLHSEENSEVVLRELRLAKNGNARSDAMRREIHLELVVGSIVVLLQFESGFRPCMVDTPHGKLILDEPCLVRLETDQEKIRVTAVRGSVGFEPNHSQVRQKIEPGYFQEWPTGNSSPEAAENEASAQEAIEKSLTVERKLLELQDRRRVAPFPWQQQ